MWKFYQNYSPDPPIDGAWSEWTAWSVCSSQCVSSRTRACDSPAPKYAGLDCMGEATGTKVKKGFIIYQDIQI